MFWNLPNMGKNKMMMVGEMGPAASASQQEPDSGSRADGKQSTDTMGSAPTPSDSAFEQQPIWTWSQFSKPPSNGKDEWIVQYMHLGYLIRRHGKVRKKAFHPIHRSCPVDGSLLDTERVALIFPLHETSRRVSQDAWTDTKGWSVEDGEDTRLSSCATQTWRRKADPIATWMGLKSCHIEFPMWTAWV